MITPPLPAEEFWFYRVSSELTLSLLHKINNELTGVIFQIENLQELAQTPDCCDPASLSQTLSDSASSLSLSINSILSLLRQNVALQRAPVENPAATIPLQSLLASASPVLRLILPRTIQLQLEAPRHNPSVFLTEEDFCIILCAAALLLHPSGSHPSATISLSFPEANPPTLLLSLQAPAPNGLTEEAHPLTACSPAWQSFGHRAARLRVKARLSLSPAPAISLIFPVAAETLV